MGLKAAETDCNISNAFGPGTANECTALVAQEVLQRRRDLKMRSIVAGYQKLTATS